MSYVAPVSAVLVMMCTASVATSAGPTTRLIGSDGLPGQPGFALDGRDGGCGRHDPPAGWRRTMISPRSAFNARDAGPTVGDDAFMGPLLAVERPYRAPSTSASSAPPVQSSG